MQRRRILILLKLIAGHFLCDYPLQGDFIGKFKNRNISRDFGIPWWHLMTAHAMIHAGMIAIITNRIDLSIIEFLIHFITDCLKCEKWIDIHVDQFIHILCKIGYWLVLINV